MPEPGPGALDAALELARMPTLAKAMRLRPLPGDVLPLIRVAAGCRDTCQALARSSGREPPLIAEAALFYLEQVLFRADGDPYRTLGASPGASRDELREHMRWLMKWLHPDRNHDEWESVFAGRVMAAWTALQEPDRQPGAEGPAPAASRDGSGSALRLRWIAEPVAALPLPSAAQLVMLVVAWMIVLALLLVPDFRDFWSPFGSAELAGTSEAKAK